MNSATQKFFKDGAGQVFAYSASGEDDAFIKPNLTPITADEAELLCAPAEPPITADKLKAIVTDYRWEVETGGLTLPGGVQVATALDDQNRITTVVANARLAGLDSVKFKAASGWVTLSVAEVEAIAAAIAMHVQACFAAECAHHEAIDALAALHADNPQALQQALEGYDIEQGWPATDLREPEPA